MARPSILPLPAAQAKAVARAVRKIEQQCPAAANRDFLQHFIPAVQAVTGNVYGAQTYQKLLREFAPGRSPSSTTIQEEIDTFRRQGGAGPEQEDFAVSEAVQFDLARRIVELEDQVAALQRERDHALAELARTKVNRTGGIKVRRTPR